ncbi:MAG: dNTP triphosphohydrolase, broad substrate specificity [uncultured Nocardioidaceae bacterium]|uniref:Deoxyguanosinetriphosphate triphosphohydrolase-like protein n=1 Tax=uncultured Nocardioidaceae bacterium TaxID=253824 RepID=A0A6J4N0L6_9ACTN|nr:MAG: dNTP triphosphohydrolase, broad substrate specificity [uncultured Nocardioidaceae bacterium]
MEPPSPYVDADVDRYHPEANRSQRSAFERDRARIVHSAALRRLAAKTQVVGPSTDDFIRNRLTHTLEVAQVGRDLANALGCHPDLVEAACLAHDLGHPPFGHNGERALHEAAVDIGGFEGNAQTFRLLTRLEAKTADEHGRSLGLNLTRASLDAATKYPWPLTTAPSPHGWHADGVPRAVRKFGVYDDDLEVFGWVREDRADGRTCVEAQVMDFADDVAYSVHDVEDGVVAGRIDLMALGDSGVRRAVWVTAREWYAPDLDEQQSEEAFARLSSVPAWPTAAYDGTRGALAGLKNLTSDLINRFCSAIQVASQQQGVTGRLARFVGDVPVPAATKTEIVVLKAIAAHLVMRADDRVQALTRQRELVSELVAALWDSAPTELEPAYRQDFAVAVDDAARRRVVVDQVAALTDPSAVELHSRLGRGRS